MLHSLLRFLEPLFQPIGFIWLLNLAGAVLLFKKRQRMAAIFVGMIAVMISVIGSHLPSQLLGSLERPYLRKGFEEVPDADAVILLGGSHEISKNDLPGFNVNGAGDRILTAFELMRRKKGRSLVIGGRTVTVDGKDRKEGDALREWFAPWRTFDAPVIVLEGSADTHDEAVQVKALADKNNWKQVLLVTSGYHMPRAEATFRKAGVTVVPVACDFRLLGTPRTGIEIFPRLYGFTDLECYLHEQIGWWVYRMRDWVGGEPATTPATGATTGDSGK